MAGDNEELGDLFGRQAAEVLPTPVSPAWFAPEARSWYGESDLSKMGKKQKQGLVSCTLTVSYAPTGRAKCRRCGELIEKGNLRLSYPFRWRACEDAYSMNLHPECYAPEVFGIKEKELRTKVFGFEALNNTERANLWKAMRGRGREAAAASESKEAKEEFAKGVVGPGVDIASLTEVPVPEEMQVPMLPFQREGLTWMVHQEASAAKGGILADEMGMGKTIQAISLLLASRQKAPCLVVCPMAACLQWASEIERFAGKGALRVMLYHGAQKAKTVSEFKKFDVVITTYQTLETDFRREMDKLRERCKHCGKLFLPEKLQVHQKYFCGPAAQRTQKQARTEKKFKDAAQKAMVSMGIKGGSASSSSASPTISNIYKEYMKEAGVDIKAQGYWNIRKEVAQRLQEKAGGAASSSAPSGNDALSRERLGLLPAPELRQLCQERGLDSAGRKGDIIDRLMDFVVRGKRGPAAAQPAKATGKMGKQMLAKAKAAAKAAAKATAKAKAAAKAAAKGKKGMQAPLPVQGGSARTVASVKAAAKAAAAAGKKGSASGGKKGAAAGGKGKATAAGSGKKRKAAEMEECGPAGTYEGKFVDLSGSPLHSMLWSRIILDEAHRIKGRTNSTALAAYELKSSHAKWCLTGTPLQNRVGELYSLIRFLRVRPYAFYYCKHKGCNCECLSFMRERYCPNCGHVRFMHFSSFKKEVSNPIIRYGYMGAGKAAFMTLRNDLLAKCMLRRTKEERKDDLHLPAMKVLIRKDKLSQQETDFYTSLYMQSQVKFNTYITSGTVLHNYAHIFDLLTSLRRAVDHPYLIVHGGAAASHRVPDGGASLARLVDVCGLCQDDICEDADETKRVSSCGHPFHLDCIKAYVADAPALPSGGVGCPVCFSKLVVDLDEDVVDDDEGDEGGKKAAGKRKQVASSAVTPKRRSQPGASAASSQVAVQSPEKPPMARHRLVGKKALADIVPVCAPCAPEKTTSAAVKMAKRNIMQKVNTAEFQSSTKIEALMDEIRKMEASDSQAKCIVFSQFGAMLELVEFRLKRAGMACVVLRGGMSIQARNDSLVAFNTDPTLKVILISLKAGGEGLNLQIANHVFLLDPWWNPACEMQAIQRAHRIGQTREVKAVRLITEGTVEEKILALQEKKQLVFDGAIDGSAASVAKLSEQDLRFLFQH